MSYEQRSLKLALKARWDILPEHVKRTHWHRFTYEEKWDLTYRHVNFDSWRYISISNWDIEYNPRLHQPEGDPVTALKRVFEDRQEHPEILEVFFYPSGKEGPSLPTYIEVLYWNGRFRYADEPQLTSILDPCMNKVEFYHPWGFWNQFDCHAEIDVAVIGQLLILRFGDHPTYSGPDHQELTTGLRELTYKLFTTPDLKVLYRVLADYMPHDTEGVLSKWGWGLDATPSELEYEQAEYDSMRIALVSCNDQNDIISAVLGGKWFLKDGYGRPVVPEPECLTTDDSDDTPVEAQPIERKRWRKRSPAEAERWRKCSPAEREQWRKRL